MVQVQLPNKVDRILKVCLLLTSIGTFAVIAIGIALVSVKNDNKKIEEFLEVGKNTHVDFENSLLMYTEKTRNTIDYLLKLRPSNDEEVINFISQIEQIGQDLHLDIELSALGELIESKNKKANKNNDETISYKISFFGSVDDLNKFMVRLESLPYFIRVDRADFRDMSTTEKTHEIQPNIGVIIKLYIKK